MLEQALQAFRSGQLQQAATLLQQLWREEPGASEVAALMGQVLRADGRWQEAICWFERALQADPIDARPLVAIGQLQRQQGNPEASRACFEQVVLQAGLSLALAPDQPLRLLELGLAYAELEQAGDAIAALRAALGADPELVEAHRSLAKLLLLQGLLSEGARHFERLAELEPGNPSPRVGLASCIAKAGERDGARQRLEHHLAEYPYSWDATYAFLFTTAGAGEDLQSRYRKVAEAHWERLGARSASPVTAAVTASPLRVGILSAELGNHPVAHFLEAFLRHHDRQRLEVELIETQPRWEGRNHELRDLVHDSLLLPQADAVMRRDLIRQRGYSVIVETSGFTTASGLDLLAERLAPVQCHYVGFHASTFLPTIDWFIADPVLVPTELEAQFSERIWRLPRPWAAYTPPKTLPEAHSLSAETAPVFGSCNQIAKLGPETLAHWAAALNAVPEARMLIKSRAAADPAVQDRITSTLAAAGVASERLRFEGWAPDWGAHMATYNRIDVALDSTPWSSATTAFEALAMGTPLVAIRGASLAGRMSSAVLEGYGEPGWIADNPAGFARIARKLTTDLSGLRAARLARRQRALAGPLFDGADLARSLGAALVEMTRQAAGSLP